MKDTLLSQSEGIDEQDTKVMSLFSSLFLKRERRVKEMCDDGLHQLLTPFHQFH